MAHEGSIAMMELNRAQWFDYHALSITLASARDDGSILPAVGVRGPAREAALEVEIFAKKRMAGWKEDYDEAVATIGARKY